MNGKTIDVINTDAEGRLVLADGLTYAKQLGATHLIDAATLTGAIGVALGTHNAGAFSNDDETFAKFQSALAVTGEKFWRMPLGEEYADQIKSDIADIKNTGGRYGGASTAAEFLHTFAEDTPWIHLDIAGMAYLDNESAWQAKGPLARRFARSFRWSRPSRFTRVHATDRPKAERYRLTRSVNPCHPERSRGTVTHLRQRGAFTRIFVIPSVVGEREAFTRVVEGPLPISGNAARSPAYLSSRA